eukprot:TRINITY_DN9669_c0_g1_i1.p1 TRINITY_DN9669_c0_g1~~TRINITY_DN9669_c0_g1_i1.p1  ORF type:complete len:443 (+),score=59.48 TRINITY_DN9669_c0_g1_i1:45-1331(+)
MAVQVSELVAAKWEAYRSCGDQRAHMRCQTRAMRLAVVFVAWQVYGMESTANAVYTSDYQRHNGSILGHLRASSRDHIKQSRNRWAAELRSVLQRRTAELLGSHGEALVAAAASTLVLCTGVWLTAGASLPIRIFSWFVLGAVFGILWALHPSTAPERSTDSSLSTSTAFTLAVGIHVGVVFALFRSAGRYVAGALGGMAVARWVGALGSASWISAEASLAAQAGDYSLLYLSFAGLLGASLSYRFEKSGLCVLSSLAGGFGLALILHWWVRWGWLVLRNIDNPVEYTTPSGHLARLFEHGGHDGSNVSGRAGLGEYAIFLVLWLNLGILGSGVQWSLFSHLWAQQKHQIASPAAESWALQYKASNALPSIAETPRGQAGVESSVYLPAQNGSSLNQTTSSSMIDLPLRLRCPSGDADSSTRQPVPRQ